MGQGLQRRTQFSRIAVVFDRMHDFVAQNGLARYLRMRMKFAHAVMIHGS